MIVKFALGLYRSADKLRYERLLVEEVISNICAVSSMKPNIDSSNCILVQDVKDVTNDQIMMGSSTQPSTEESLPTSTAEHSASATTVHSSLQHQQPSQQQQQQQQQQQPQTQWSPLPLLEQTELDMLHTATIPPYQFWNSEFRNKQPAFINFNFTLPWGASFAVYGRRNVVPSVTQYDFVEFVKGGRVDHRLRKKRDLSEGFTLDEVNYTYQFRFYLGWSLRYRKGSTPLMKA
ncbi:unnamed protein product [Psylliodes chrysocephalus]|uniref:Teneurin-1-4-like galactose-binding domain-containing protein n=1 Tax=Psylliodes chrysocephalus TaxID=3402493 RepID=A0A9P0D6D0_9CUCU|nr:unnamed protein product [Psylliodes chrysocephala]